MPYRLRGSVQPSGCAGGVTGWVSRLDWPGGARRRVPRDAEQYNEGDAEDEWRWPRGADAGARPRPQCQACRLADTSIVAHNTTAAPAHSTHASHRSARRGQAHRRCPGIGQGLLSQAWMASLRHRWSLPDLGVDRPGQRRSTAEAAWGRRGRVVTGQDGGKRSGTPGQLRSCLAGLSAPMVCT